MTRRRFALRFVRGLFTAAWQSVITWVVVIAAITAVVALVASQFATIDALRTRNFQLGAASSESSKRYDRLFDEYSKLYDESEQQGVKPSTTKPDDVPSTATSGTTGAAGAAGVAGADGADGSDGRDGRDGADGSPGATGATGATGDMGVPGQTGATGETGSAGATGSTGAQGPAGPAGTPGADGAAGKDGRGIASLTCNADGTWTVTFTDDTTQTIDGPCRVDVITTPTPAPSEGSQ
jgi:hypothetical protein